MSDSQIDRVPENGSPASTLWQRSAPSFDPALVPTSDPAAALRFCQALAQMLGQPTPEPGVVPTPSPPDLSVVMPVYNEEQNLPALYQRLTAALEPLPQSYELVFVDDGSRDQSMPYLHSVAALDPRVVIVELARNFGHQVAISAGLDFAQGRGIIVMDADLQDPPEVLPQFIAKWQEGYQVVYAIREQRKEGWPKRAAYALFYRLLQRIAQIDIPLDAGDFCIMDRQMVDVLNGMPERNRFVRGIRSWVGLKQVGLAYERHARYAGRPKYTFRRLVHLALDGIVSFSYAPLRLSTALGFGISFISVVLAVFYSIQKITVGLNPPGFATLVVAIFFLAGIQMLTIGVIGEYIGRIFEEVKQRPLYVVRRTTGGKHAYSDAGQ